MKAVLVINSGSSSIKYRLYDVADGNESNWPELAAGQLERVGLASSSLVQTWRGADGGPRRQTDTRPVADHRQGLEHIAEMLGDSGVIGDASTLYGIGHRVVHGGERFHCPTLIDREVVEAIRAMAPLAPLHNPANLTGIEVALELQPGVPQVAVFDTAFHHTIPRHAYLYALPYQLYDQHQVRRYGFHGTSHHYVARRAAAYLGRPLESLNFITLHLGNGASATAIQGGRSIDTSMGLTPLEGLIMGTRSGDLDPAIPFYLARATGMEYSDIEALLNQESGLKGVCGVSDMREVHRRAEGGDRQATLALEMVAYRLKKYIGAYSAVLGGVDAIVYTGGIGENDADLRRRACCGLESLGIHIDPAKNRAARGTEAAVQAADSRVRILVIPTNEELYIAASTVECVENSKF